MTHHLRHHVESRLDRIPYADQLTSETGYMFERAMT